MRNYLNDTFPGSCVGRRGAILWPHRSEDLNPSAFLERANKNTDYNTQPDTLEYLRGQIIDVCRELVY